MQNPYLIKNWVRLLIHFVEMAARRPFPAPYKPGDPWSHFLWLDPKDAFRLLGFGPNPEEYRLSPGLEQTRNWFLARMGRYMDRDEPNGPRHYAWQEVQEMLAKFRERGTDIRPETHLSPTDLEDALFHEEMVT